MEPESLEDTRPSTDSHLSWFRTRLAIERTLMAWLRNAVALIGFGFVLVQFFEQMNASGRPVNPNFPNAPRFFGLALILFGVLSLAAGIAEYHWTVRHFRTGDYEPIAGVNIGRVAHTLYLVAIVVGVIGVLAFISVYNRLV